MPRMSAQLKVHLVSLDRSVALSLCCRIPQFTVVVCLGQLLTMFLSHFSLQSPTQPKPVVTAGPLGSSSLANREVLTGQGGLLAGREFLGTGSLVQIRTREPLPGFHLKMGKILF